MSLIRQLWLAVVTISLIILAGSLAVSMLTARDYLEQQLHRQNMDNASSLALSMSQQSKDAVTVELQVAALFDTGHYQSIVLLDPQGKPLVERVQTRSDAEVPEWFVGLFPIGSVPGRAQVTDGWKQFGVVTVISHNRFAYQALWQGLFDMIGWFLVAGAASGLVGTLLIRGIRRPLEAVVEQAHAIRERRFIKIPEPRTPELRSMVRAMNEMVDRLRQMFAEEAARLESLRMQANHDPLTGLANRSFFLNRLRTALESEEAAPSGVLVLLRLADLNELNQRLGHARTDALLRQAGLVLQAAAARDGGEFLAARMNGPDFALLAPNAASAADLAREMAEHLGIELQPNWPEIPDLHHLAAVRYRRGQAMGELLAAADTALAMAQNRGANAWHAVEDEDFSRQSRGSESWRHMLDGALAEGRLKLVLYPVVGAAGHALHQEGVIRVQAERDGPWLAAGDFMPMAARLKLTGSLDLGVIRQALDIMVRQEGEMAVNLSAETIADWGFHNDLVRLLEQHRPLCRRLWMEVPEYGAFQHLDAFRELARKLKQLGCRVGIEHFGHRLGEMGRISDIGLDYLKVDAGFVRGIDQNPGNRDLLQGLCKVAHSFGIMVIATGAQSAEELEVLPALGFDGATGPAVGA